MLGNVRTEHQLTFLTVARTLKHYLFRPRKAIAVERREIGKYLAGRRLQKLGYTDYYVGKKLPPGAIGPDWADLYNMYTLVRAKRPQAVAEIGSGCSTAIFAQALFDNQRDAPGTAAPKLYSLDASEYWLEATNSYLPEHLKPLVQFCVCEPMLREVDGEQVSIVEPWPCRELDFLYVDGGLAEGNRLGADAVVLEETARPNWSILVDGRGPTVAYLERCLKRDYRITRDTTHFWTLFEDRSGA